MRNIQFITNQKSLEFLYQINKILQIELDISSEEAVSLINEFWSGIKDIDKDYPFLFRDEPFYYAFCIIHHPVIGDNKPNWYLNEKRYREIHSKYSIHSAT